MEYTQENKELQTDIKGYIFNYIKLKLCYLLYI